MICPDCEQEVDKIVNSTGTCKKCYCRMQNMKYHKKEYVPIKNMKGTAAYDRLMNRRDNSDKKTEEKGDVKEVKVSVKKPDKVEKYIEEKIQQIMTHNKIEPDLIKIDEVIITLKLMTSLFKDFDDRKDVVYKAIGLLDLYKCDIQHEIENCDRTDKEKYDYINDKNYYLLQHRRVYKNAWDAYDKIKNMAFVMNGVPGFIKMLEDHIEILEKLKYDQEHPVYNVRIDEDLLENDFAKENKKKKYDVKVMVTGLYGSKSPNEYSRTVEAYDKNEAKKFVENNLATFKNIQIGRWRIEEVKA